MEFISSFLATVLAFITFPFVQPEVFDPAPLLEQISELESQLEEQNLGAFDTVGGKTYYLSGGGVGASDTSITLTSFQVPISNVDLTIDHFGGTIGYLTIEPGSQTRQEFISFTGITQNADDTATLTGVQRGLAPVSPYTASTTFQKAHPGGSIVVISNPPQFYEQFAAKDNNETITGQWTFDVFPITASTSFASATTSGDVELATGGEAASSTITGDQGTAKLVLHTDISTSSAPSSGNVIPVTNDSGNLDEGFLPTTLDQAYTLNATTTLATTTINGKNPIVTKVLLSTTTTVTQTGLGSEETLLTGTIPANTLGTDGGIVFEAYISEFDAITGGGGDCSFIADYGGTNIIATGALDSGSAVINSEGYFRGYILANGATNSQFGSGNVMLLEDDLGTAQIASLTGTASEDSTTSQTFTLSVDCGSEDAGNKVVMQGAVVYSLK